MNGFLSFLIKRGNSHSWGSPGPKYASIMLSLTLYHVDTEELEHKLLRDFQQRNFEWNEIIENAFVSNLICIN